MGLTAKSLSIRKKHIPTDEEQAVLDELAEFEASLENEPQNSMRL